MESRKKRSSWEVEAKEAGIKNKRKKGWAGAMDIQKDANCSAHNPQELELTETQR